MNSRARNSETEKSYASTHLVPGNHSAGLNITGESMLADVVAAEVTGSQAMFSRSVYRSQKGRIGGAYGPRALAERVETLCSLALL
ncbi:unnamed protein product [Arctogadus glacialis]